MATSTIKIDGLQRSRLVNRCLLFTSLLFGGLLVASLLTTLRGGTLERSFMLVAVPAAGVLWLLVAYLLGRWQRLQLAGALIVMLLVVTLALALYLLPSYSRMLLPTALLPVALAALLLSERAIYVVAALTALVTIGTSQLAQTLPPPALGVALPAPNSWLTFGVLTLTLLLLALILAPLRASFLVMTNEMQQLDMVRQEEVQARRIAEQICADLQAQVRQHQQHLAAIVQHVGDGLITVSNGRVQSADLTAQQLWAHVSAEKLVAQPFALVRAALVGPAASLRYVDLIELPPDSVAPGGYTHVLHDRRAQANYARLRDEQLGLLTDEMRNPLTSMLTALDLTLGQRNLPDDLDRVLIGARQSGQRLLGLVSLLLEINQIEQNPQVLRRAPIVLSRIIEGGIAQLAPLAQQGAVTVVVEYGSESTVFVDSDRMQRAFANLLEHALRHSPPYSTVQVRTARQGEAVEVRIVDQGPGLPTEQRETLFEQRAATDERGAPALGLAFSKLVVEAHGGRVRADANSGQGSAYIFTLPVERG